MSVELFRQRLSRAQLHPNDLKWMPQWLDEYARLQEAGAEHLQVQTSRVLAFLRSLGDRGAPAWQRLQAARAAGWDQTLVLRMLAATIQFAGKLTWSGEHLLVKAGPR